MRNRTSFDCEDGWCLSFVSTSHSVASRKQTLIRNDSNPLPEIAWTNTFYTKDSFTSLRSAYTHSLMPHAPLHAIKNPFKWDVRTYHVAKGPHSSFRYGFEVASSVDYWVDGSLAHVWLARRLCEAYATPIQGPILCLSNFQRVVQVKGCQSCHAQSQGLSTNKTPSWRRLIFHYFC